MSTPAPQPRRFSGRFYPIDRFDKHLCLKPPFGLLVCMVILCRDMLFAVASAGSSLKGQGVDMGMLAAHEYRALFFLGLVPAMMVFGAYVQRAPDGGAFARWIWKHGAQLMSLSALIQSIPAFVALWSGPGVGADLYQSPWVLPVTAGVIFYLFKSKAARDAFSDFPERR